MVPDISRVRELSAEDVAPVVAVLCDAFGGYPTMRHVLQDSAGGYSHDLQRLIRFFVMARLLREEPILGAGQDSGLGGVALVSDRRISRHRKSWPSFGKRCGRDSETPPESGMRSSAVPQLPFWSIVPGST